ncbi:MAG: Fe-Mn family superoxide dismutase [Deltaproteobacteria bacterium]|nr:Fe-Mn family superoxide dismutase [Deltaproteobacteria bacterium]
MITQCFGSLDRLRAQILGAAKAASRWIVLVADSATRTLETVQKESHAMGPWSATRLLVLDVYEHAYAIDNGANKPGYFDAFWRNVGWNVCYPVPGARALQHAWRLARHGPVMPWERPRPQR